MYTFTKHLKFHCPFSSHQQQEPLTSQDSPIWNQQNTVRTPKARCVNGVCPSRRLHTMNEGTAMKFLYWILGAITLVSLAGISTLLWVAFDDEIVKYPESMWIAPIMHTEIVLVLLPTALWVIYSLIFHSKTGATKASHTERTSLSRYFRRSAQLWTLQSATIFLIPLSISVLMNEGNPPMLIAALAGASCPLFLALTCALLAQHTKHTQ